MSDVMWDHPVLTLAMVNPEVFPLCIHRATPNEGDECGDVKSLSNWLCLIRAKIKPTKLFIPNKTHIQLTD